MNFAVPLAHQILDTAGVQAGLLCYANGGVDDMARRTECLDAQTAFVRCQAATEILRFSGRLVILTDICRQAITGALPRAGLFMMGDQVAPSATFERSNSLLKSPQGLFVNIQLKLGNKTRSSI
jgi:hypothetical protein